MSFRRIAGVAGVVFVVLLAVQLILTFDAPLAGDDLGDVVEFFQDDPGKLELGFGAGTLASLFFPVFLVGVVACSVAASRSSALPSWMPWLGGIAAAAGAVSSVSTVDFASGNAVGSVGFVFFILFLVWVLVASVVMAREDVTASA